MNKIPPECSGGMTMKRAVNQVTIRIIYLNKESP